MSFLAYWIKEQVKEQEKKNSDLKVKFLCSLPENTFRAIYNECMEDWAGCLYNGVYYDEWEVYISSHLRDSYAEVLL